MLAIKMPQTPKIRLLQMRTETNSYIIPLDLEMLDSTAPYYQAGLGNRLCYELTFNDYNRVIKSPISPKVPDTKYKITDISLEYEIATQPDLVRSIRSEYEHIEILKGGFWCIFNNVPLSLVQAFAIYAT